MLHFLVNPTSGTIKLPLFQRFGIGNSSPAEIDDLLVHISSPRLHKFSWGFANIQSVLSAQHGNMVAKALNDSKPILREFHIDLQNAPTLAVSFNSLTEIQTTNLAKFGMVMRDADLTYFGSPSSSNLSAILAMGALDYRKFTPGAVDLDGYKAYVQLMRAAMITSTYSHVLRARTAEALVTNSTVAYTGNANITVMSQMGGSNLTTGTGFIAGSVFYAVDETYFTPFYDTTKITQPGVIVSNGNALPSREHGFFLPYFQGMVAKDPSSAFHVFQTYFSNCLAPSKDTPSQLRAIRRGLRNIAGHPAGMMLSHMFRGVKLAIEGSCSVAFLFNGGRYRGLVIQGDASTTISYNANTHQAISADELDIEIASFDSYDSKLQSIVDLFNNKGAVHATQFSYTADQLNTNRKIMNLLFKVSLSEYPSSFISDLQKALEGFFTEERFAPIDKKHVDDFLSFVDTGDVKFLGDYNANTTSFAMSDLSRVAVGLGMFGNSAPSLNYGDNKNSNAFPLQSGTDNNLTVGPLGYAKLRYLPFTNMPYQKAVAQWKLLFNDAVFYLPKVPAKKPGKNEPSSTKIPPMTPKAGVAFAIGEVAEFAAMYSKVKAIAIKMSSEVKGGKRKRDQQEGEAGPSKKKKEDEAKKNASYF